MQALNRTTLNYFKILGTAETDYEIERVVLARVSDRLGMAVPGGEVFAMGLKRSPVLIVDLDAEDHHADADFLGRLSRSVDVGFPGEQSNRPIFLSSVTTIIFCHQAYGFAFHLIPKVTSQALRSFHHTIYQEIKIAIPAGI